MEDTNMMTLLAGFVTLALSFVTMGAGVVFAHCDTMDGPIIKSSQQALETGNKDLVLMWDTEEGGTGTEAGLPVRPGMSHRH